MNELIRDTVTPFFEKIIRKIDHLEDRISILDKKISHLDTIISNISITTLPNMPNISYNDNYSSILDKHK